MPTSVDPLLHRHSSEDPNESRDGTEQYPLLDRQQMPLQSRPQRRSWSEIGAYVWATLATIAVIVLAVVSNQSNHNAGSSKPTGKRNLVFMVSDGMGPTSLSLTRSFRQYSEGLKYNNKLLLDSYVIGQSRTRSTSSLITDSAAGATAFACGKKSYNGAISTLPDHSPCGTVLEAAKKAGYMTGLVVTTRITDATPACFAAHVNKRAEEDRIAEQLLGDYPLGRTVDLILGAGRCHFLAKGTQGSCRNDSNNMVKVAKDVGFTYIDDRQGFDSLKHGRKAKLPLLGLFADQDIPYEIDRQHETDIYPSLQEMTETALNTLKEATKNSDKGFFLMVEGSRIDHAGHANDPAAQVHEILAYDKAFKSVLEFLDKDSTQGLLVATSDHETGGLATALQPEPFEYPEYRWFPSGLVNATHSTTWLHHEYQKHLQSSKTSVTTRDETTDFLRDAIPKYLGVHDVTDDEINLLFEHPDFSLWVFAEIISKRSETGWTTHGHSAADVNIYASDHGVATNLVGNHENTEVGDFLRYYLDVDVNDITRELKEKTAVWDAKYAGDHGWMGSKPKGGERMDGGNHIERFHPRGMLDQRCDICG